MPDTIDVIQGTFSTSLNAVVGALPVQSYARRITSITVTGPARSTFGMFRGGRLEPSLQITSTPTQGGQNNSYDTTRDGAALLVGPGEQVIGAWTGGATAAGQVGTATVRSAYGKSV